MSRIRVFFFFIAGVFATLLSAQTSFDVISVTGIAKVQRSDKKTWEKISAGTRIFDNDLVETFFQTKLTLTFEQNNMVILGSNSKALLNISKRSAQDSGSIVNLTLFGGGIFTKAVSKTHVSIYTANAVGDMDSGSVSTVADTKSGETGFQSLGGRIYVRNIAQQKGKELRSGMTTMILPNKEPTAPLYITHRHLAVLKLFFGEEYIESQMKESGIEPTNEIGSGTRHSLSHHLVSDANNKADQGMYKSQFNPDRIYGIILEDRNKDTRFYAPIRKPSYAGDNRIALNLSTDFGFYDGKSKPSYTISPAVNFKPVSAALRFTIAKDFNDEIKHGFDTPSGLLDKIDHIKIGKDSTYLYAGSLTDYTLGYGLIVSNFTNEDPREIFHPLGIKGQLQLLEMNFKAFLSDVLNPRIGGVHFSIEPSLYSLGLGYYFDFDQYTGSSDLVNPRYFDLPKAESPVPDPDKDISNAHIYEINFASDLINHHTLRVRLAFELAQKLLDGNDGMLIRFPTVDFDFNHVGAGLSFLTESGRLISNQFGSQYLLNRYRLKSNRSGDGDTLITQNNYLSKDRLTFGMQLFLRANPIKGLDIDFNYKQDIFGRDQIRLIQTDSTGDSSMDVSGNFSYSLVCRFNNKLVPFIKYGELYIQQFHGMIYPFSGGYGTSWGFEYGGHLMTKQLFLNTAIVIGAKSLYVDNAKYLNNKVDLDDRLFEVYAGLQIGLL
ncbi:MAG: hypothetical protein GX556_14010 [Fibrobacter sp.]|nr:hypothetical protein [Fibrobacter sp.]